MTTIAVVRKGGYAAIAADTLTKYGYTKESADYVVNHEKILKAGSSYIALSGTVALHQAMEEAGPRTPRARLDEVLQGLMEVVDPLGPPQERMARRRLMIEYADVLTAYAGLMRELAQDVEDEEQPRPTVPNY